MTGKQLRAIRKRLGLTQVELAARLKLTGNSVARLERDDVAITEPMALLVSYVARESEGERASHRRAKTRGRRNQIGHGTG
jgi:transcriptional regulator with XRE-family HTH domain